MPTKRRLLLLFMLGLAVVAFYYEQSQFRQRSLVQDRENPVKGRWQQSQQELTRLSEEEALKMADEVAEQELGIFNKTHLAERLEAGVPGGPFLLDDYKRDVTRDIFQGRTLLRVNYQYTKRSAHGHPQHFGVWVYTDTGETHLARGR